MVFFIIDQLPSRIIHSFISIMDEKQLIYVTTQFRRRSKGPVMFNGCSPAGDVIIIENLHSKKSYDLSGWTIERQTDTEPMLKYVIPDRLVLPASGSVEFLAKNAPLSIGDYRHRVIRTDLTTWNPARQWSITRLFDGFGNEKAIFLHRILSDNEQKKIKNNFAKDAKTIDVRLRSDFS